jgi:hypothetical protein
MEAQQLKEFFEEIIIYTVQTRKKQLGVDVTTQLDYILGSEGGSWSLQ